MNSRERLLCVLEGGTPDMVPVSPFIQEEYLSYYFNKKNTDRLFDAVALRKELDFDLVTRQYVNEIPYFLQRSFINWEVENKVEVVNGNYIRTIKVKTPVKELRQVEGAPYNEKILSGIHFSTMEYLIKDQDDFEVFKKYCPRREKQDVDHILESGEIASIVVKVFSKLIPHKDNSFQAVCLNHFTNPVAQIGYTQRESFYLTLIGHLKDIVHNLRQRIARKCAQLFNYGIGIISAKQVGICTCDQAIEIIFVVLIRKPCNGCLF